MLLLSIFYDLNTMKGLGMGISKAFRWGWLVGCTFVLMACSTNPVTGQRELTLMSPSQEVAMGEKNYEPYQQTQGGRYVVDPDLNFYVNQVGQKLARVSDRPDLPYEFVVLNNGTPNAWALPGGKIAINRGLLVLLEDEAQLAAVLGHEIVHAAARHSARQMTQATLLNVGVGLASVFSQQSEYGEWLQMGAGVGAKAWQASYGRDQELEADEYGVEYMVKAGYDPQAAVELQEKFVELSKGRNQGGLEAWFSTHPPSEVRVRRNQELALKYSGNTRNRGAYMRAIAQIQKDKPAYDTYQKALALAAKDTPQAKSLLAKAIRLQPREPLFHVTLGQMQLQDNEAAKAERSFSEAAKYNPEYYMGHLGLGLSKYQKRDLSGAQRSLNASMKILPTEMATYYLGELALAKNDVQTAKHYFQQLAGGQSELAQKARSVLTKMEPASVSP